MIVDKKYCMNSFLMYRSIVDSTKTFHRLYTPNLHEPFNERIPIKNSQELEKAIRSQVEKCVADGKTALALSGGIDSAILAKFMPKGSRAYTFRCIVPGVEVTNEVPMAHKYAEECGLDHEIIEVYWEDFEKYSPILMKHKGAPIHSIEVQIYKAALQAKRDGFERVLYGESADCVFGGLSNILSKDWTIGEFIERYQYIATYKVLRDPQYILEPYLRHEKDGYIDAHEFMSTEFYKESTNSYINASQTAGMGVVMPYANCYLYGKLDYDRVRNGENKYLVREVFKRLYPDFSIPPKTPMPRPMNEWLANWEGPKREEFYPYCVQSMNGDQKWLLWSLEKFLNMVDETK